MLRVRAPSDSDGDDSVTVFGSMARVDVNAWRTKLSTYSLRSIYHCEYAMEVFTDELLHAKLKSSTITAKFKRTTSR